MNLIDSDWLLLSLTTLTHEDLMVLLDFFKCTPPPEKPLGQHNEGGKIVVLTKPINVEIR